MVERSDRTCSTGEGNGKPLQYSCLENHKNSMKRQKDMTLKDELPRLVGAQYATGEEQRKDPEGMKRLSQSGNNAHLWICLVVKVKSDAVKNNIAQEPGILGPLVQFSCSVVSDSLRPRGLQHARLPCPSPTPRMCSNSHS